MIKKVGQLVGQIDCPDCFSLLEWDNALDISIVNGNEFIVCPVCGKHIMLDPKLDYWVVKSSDGGGSDEGGEGGGEGGDDEPGNRKAVVGTAIVGQDKVSSED